MVRVQIPAHSDAEKVFPSLPSLPVVERAKASARLLTSPEAARVAEMVRGLAADHAVLVHRVDARTAENIARRSAEPFVLKSIVGMAATADSETAARECLELGRSGGGDGAPHLVLMAIPKRFFPAGRPVRRDDVDDLLLDMAQAGLIPGWGMPRAWIRATVDCRTQNSGIRDNPAFDPHFYDARLERRDLAGFPNLHIRAR